MTPNEEAKTVGDLLRQARTQKGLSLESIQQRTRISRKFLVALEENRFEDFPAPVYLRGFLNTYCEFLDLDFNQVWPLAGLAKPTPPPEPASERLPEPEGRGFHFPPTAVIPILTLGLVILVALILWATRSKNPNKTERLAERLAVVEPVKPVHAPQGHSLTLVITERTWLRLKADGSVKFEGQMPSGTSKSWHTATGFRLRAAAPERIRVNLDGRFLPLSSLTPDSAGDYRLPEPPGAP